MAEVDTSSFSLMSLEDELTCSICLSPFTCPVTIPCGHNFCQECLLATWADSSYSCPQCRTQFLSKPELKKNTVLSNVVETFTLRLSRSESLMSKEENPAQKANVIRCDTCMEAEASQTCLTCMASFCEEHLRPHRDNPTFRVHQLSEPVGDLQQRVCPDHQKLMELFCSQHGRPICSLCLQVHKDCNLMTPEEQRNLKQCELRDKVGILDSKIERTENVMCQMKEAQSNLKDGAIKRKAVLAAVYQQMRDLLALEERKAQIEVDSELEVGQAKLREFLKRFTDNNDTMRKAREDIHNLLSLSQTTAFLQATYDLPKVVKFEPHMPRITLDSKKVTATQDFANALKEHLTQVFQQPVEDRLPIINSRPAIEKAAPVSKPASTNTTRPQAEPAPEQKLKPASQSPASPHIRPYLQPIPGPLLSHMGSQAGWNPLQYGQCRPAGMGQTPFLRAPLKPTSASGFTPFNPGTHQQSELLWTPGNLGNPRLPRSQSPGCQLKPGHKKKPQKDKMGSKRVAHSMENLLDIGGKDKPRGRPPAAQPSETPDNTEIAQNISSGEKRSELLKYGTILTLDPKTVHKRVTLSEGFTKASVSDEHTNYPDCPERFTVCSQVLTSQGFSMGRHYWEVRLSNNNIIGVGLAYGSIDRKGPSSRLGRNAQSWCVEWFNVKLSAWHNSRETVLVNPNPKRVGILLDCEEGTATFYNVADRAYPFHCFVFPFAEPVYPAFWMFSSGSSITLCKLQG